MSWFVSDEREPVDMGACLCPGTPHPDGDTVWLRRELDVPGGLAALSVIQRATEASITEDLGRCFLRHGIMAWSFIDETGAPVPVNAENVERLRWSEPIIRIADRASELYGDAALAPLQARPPASSRSGRTASSTSASRAGSSKPRKR